MAVSEEPTDEEKRRLAKEVMASLHYGVIEGKNVKSIYRDRYVPAKPQDELFAAMLERRRLHMRLVNGWGSETKRWDRVSVELRISKLTLFALVLDLHGHHYSITFMNFRLEYGQ